MINKDGTLNINVNLKYDKDGYQIFSYKNINYRTHRLVAKMFGNKDIEGMDVHHIDGNKLNNHIDNLMVLTKSDHTSLHNTMRTPADNLKMSESVKNSLKHKSVMETRHIESIKSKLDKQDIEDIINSNECNFYLQKKYNLHSRDVNKIRNNHSYYRGII